MSRPYRGQKPNILLLVLDSLRADRLENQDKFDLKTPTLNNLSNDGAYYKNAYSTGSWTVPAHGSLFTGKLPRQHGAHAEHKFLDVDSSDTLAGRLSEAGYKSVGFSPNPWVAPEFGYATGFDEFYELRPKLPFSSQSADPRESLDDPSLGEILRWILSGNPLPRFVNGLYEKFLNEFPYTPAEQVNEDVLDWLATAEEPWFAFVNYMDVHEPYGLQSANIPDDKNLNKDVLSFEWNLHSYENPPASGTHESIRQFYDASLSYLDENIGQLLNEIELDNTLLIVVSDHGQSLGENNYWGHGTHLSVPLIHVPLIVRTPANVDLDLEPNEIIDLSDLPDLITETAGVDTPRMSWKSNIRGLDELSVAESFGPHQQAENLPDNVSKTGYRTIRTSDGCMTHNLDTATRQYSNDQLQDQTKGNLVDLETLVLERVEKTTTNDDSNINTETENRLQDLGYL